MRQYIVRYGDSLWKIANTHLKDPNRWQEIATLNELANPNQILIGQRLILPEDTRLSTTSLLTSHRQYLPTNHANPKNEANQFPAKCFTFMIADEILPNGSAVRKIIVPNKQSLDPLLFEQIIKPEKFGIHPINPNSPVSIGRHVLGRTDSRYISLSTRPFGTPRFEGTPYWINMDKVVQSGATVHDANAIIRDLERIAEKSANKTEFVKYIEDIKYKSRAIDKEILIEGHIPANAVKGPMAKGLTTGFKIWGGVGVVISVYDLSKAAARSHEEQSIKPLAAQTVREIGGWGSAVAGAKIGGALGAMVGIETGPGAVFSAAAGGLVFGIAGYFGADWIANYIEKGN